MFAFSDDAVTATAAGVSFVVAPALLYHGYRVIRQRSSVRVNCWFCNFNTSVPYDNRNCWECPSCEQYNGFEKNGDYNKPIPAQFNENLNHSVVQRKLLKTNPGPTLFKRKPAPNFGSTNGLCDSCNRNQELKVQRLAQFEPSSETNFDAEYEQFKRRIDKIYDLCSKCKIFLQTELTYQNQKLNLSARVLEHLRQFGRAARSTISSRTRATARQHNVSNRQASKAVLFARILLTLSNLFAIVLWFASLRNLQVDSGTYLLDIDWLLPIKLLNMVPYVYSQATAVVFSNLSIFFIAHYLLRKDRRRVNASDLVLILLWFIQLGINHDTFGHVLFASKQDCFVWHAALSTCVCLVATWVTFAPRQLVKCSSAKRRYSTNNKSNFSTPSNCSLSSPESIRSANALDSRHDAMDNDIATHDRRQKRGVSPGFERTRSALRDLRLGTPVKNDGEGSVATQPIPPAPRNLFARPMTGVPFLPPQAADVKENKRPILSPARFNVQYSSRNGPSIGDQPSSSAASWCAPSSSYLHHRSITTADDVQSIVTNLTSISRQGSIAGSCQSEYRASDFWWKVLFGIVLISSVATNIAVLCTMVYKQT